MTKQPILNCNNCKICNICPTANVYAAATAAIKHQIVGAANADKKSLGICSICGFRSILRLNRIK